MLHRGRFLGYAALTPAMLAWPPALHSLFATPINGPAPEVSARARAVHRRALVFDGHVHALDREFYHGGSFGDRKPDGYWDLPRAHDGGVGAFFLSVYIPEEYYPGSFETTQALRRIEHALEQFGLCREVVELALDADDIERIGAKGKMAAVLDIEG